MRVLTVIISAMLMILISTQASAQEGKFSCRIITADGSTAIGYSSKSKAEALENARFTCGDKMIDQYIATRGSISPSVQDDIIDSCVNKTCIN